MGTSRIFESSDTSWPSRCVIVVIHDGAVWGFVQLMTEQKPLIWTADEITEEESPRAGVGNVIEKSYGHACPTCGHDMNSVCDQCASEAAV